MPVPVPAATGEGTAFGTDAPAPPLAPVPPMVAIHASVSAPPAGGIYHSGQPISLTFHAVRLPSGPLFAITEATAEGTALIPVLGVAGGFTYTPTAGRGKRAVSIVAKASARIGCGAMASFSIMVE